MIDERVWFYDAGDAAFDRYTVVFADRRFSNSDDGFFQCLGMSVNPTSTSGYAEHASAMPGDHLGKRIRFGDMPAACQKLVLRDLDAGLDVLSSADYDLSAEDLSSKYVSSDGLGHHPNFARSEWKQAVANDDTIDSYWGWVTHQVEEERNGYGDFADGGISEIEQNNVESSGMDRPRDGM